LGAMGVAGLVRLVGEFVGGGGDVGVHQGLLGTGAATVVLTASYILWTVQRVFMGENPVYKHYADITPRELACIIPLVVLCVLFGVAPALILNWMEPSVTQIIDSLASVRP